MRFITLVLAGLSFLLPPAAWGRDDPDEIPVLIAASSDTDGKPAGVAPMVDQIVQRLAAESGLKLVARAYPWRRAQMLAESGKGLLYGAAITPERLAVFDFTKPLYAVNQWLITEASRPFRYQGWDDLRGKTISIASGSKFSAEFEERKNVLFYVAENSDSVSSRMKMLALGRVDAVLIDSYRTAAKFEERLNCLYGPVGKFTVLRKPLGGEPVLLAVPKASPLHGTLPVLNEAIDRLEKSQAIHKILESRSAVTGC